MESKVESLVSEILEAEALIPDKSRPKSWTASSNDSMLAIADDEESLRATDESESATAIASNEQARQPESEKSQGSEVRSKGEESSLSHLVSRLKPSEFVPDRTATPPIGDDASDRVNAATQNPTSVTYPNAELLNPPKEAKQVDLPPPLRLWLVPRRFMGVALSMHHGRAALWTRAMQSLKRTTPKLGLDKEPKRSLSSPTSYQDEAYILGAGDRIGIDIFKVPEYSKEYLVLVDGSLNLPLIGKVSVKGMTLKQAGDRQSANYNRFLQNPLVTLSLLAPRPLSIGISGEVNRPGAYTIPLTEGTKFPRVTQVIQLAGGITQAANLRGVQLRHC